METKKRLFFGLEVEAPWPNEPEGRVIPFDQRHLTLAFLGDVDWSVLEPKLESFPAPALYLGSSAKMEHLYWLPDPGDPNVVAYSVRFYDQRVLHCQMEVERWLKAQGYPISRCAFMPHISAARRPLEKKAWESVQTPFPATVTSLHLYESLGSLQYRSLWHIPIQAPFTELSHTADLAFRIYGEDLDEIYVNAATALAFHSPSFVEGLFPKELGTLDDVIIALNDLITAYDMKRGSPFKAVSFHGALQEENDLIVWEMIVDV